MVWMQIRKDVLSVLIWVQTVCKGDLSAYNKSKGGGGARFPYDVYVKNEGSGENGHKPLLLADVISTKI